ncbi:MAG: hypothetical protein IKB01_12135 [Lachnospiraceae bacterium]|nr:hypothetical protein [Lachnospiraceae bacterium]
MEIPVLRIDNEFKHLICPLQRKEYVQLEQNILADGCRDPIVVWNDVIVDGHNRYEICKRHKISFSIRTIQFECREAAIAWICANQLGRRNISDETRRFLIGMQYENEKVVSKVKNKQGKNQYTSPSNQENSEEMDRHYTAVKIGKENNISAGTVQKYAYFTRALETIGKKEPKMVPKILSGQYKFSHKTVIDMANLSEEEIRRINRRMERNPADYIQNRAVRKSSGTGKKYEAIPKEEQQGPSVKDMPAFDPDAEISSLTLTIPSWQSSMERAKTAADLSIVSSQAKIGLVNALYSLKETIASLLQEMEGLQ